MRRHKSQIRRKFQKGRIAKASKGPEPSQEGVEEWPWEMVILSLAISQRAGSPGLLDGICWNVVVALGVSKS